MKTILFDLDKTLIDTSKLVHELIEPALAKEIKIDLEAMKSFSNKYKSTLKIYSAFDPGEFLELLSQEFNTNKKDLEKIFFTPEFYSQSLYAETLPTLSKFQKTHSLGIYSEGVEAWQRKKLALSNLDKFFDAKLIFISSDKKAPEFIKKLPKNAFVIDDRLDYVDNLKIRKDLYPIWLDRNCGSDEIDAHTITSLNELVEVIK